MTWPNMRSIPFNPATGLVLSRIGNDVYTSRCISSSMYLNNDAPARRTQACRRVNPSHVAALEKRRGCAREGRVVALGVALFGGATKQFEPNNIP